MAFQLLTDAQRAASMGYYQPNLNPFFIQDRMRQQAQQRSALEKQLEKEGRQLPEGYMTAPTDAMNYRGSGGVNLSTIGGPGRAQVGMASIPGQGRFSGQVSDVPIYADMVVAPPIPQTPVIQEEVKKATAELTEEAKTYRAQAQEALSAAEKIRAGLQDEEARQQRAYELQSKLAAEAFSREEASRVAAERRAAAAAEQGRREQATMIANRARGAQTAGMKIMPATTAPTTSGTQAFRRRPGYNLPIRSASGINTTQSTTLNV